MKNPFKAYWRYEQRQQIQHHREHVKHSFRYEILQDKQVIAIMCGEICIEYVPITITVPDLLAAINKYRDQAIQYIQDTYGEDE